METTSIEKRIARLNAIARITEDMSCDGPGYVDIVRWSRS